MDGITLQVAIVFALLGSDNWHVREAVAIPPHVAQLGIFHSDPEIACRCERALRVHTYAWIDQVIEALKPASGVWPWCDGARGVQWADFMQAARDGTPAEQQGLDGKWGEYRNCTVLWLRSEILAGTPASRLRELLAEMAETEAKWWAARPKPMPAEELPAPQMGP